MQQHLYVGEPVTWAGAGDSRPDRLVCDQREEGAGTDEKGGCCLARRVGQTAAAQPAGHARMWMSACVRSSRAVGLRA